MTLPDERRSARRDLARTRPRRQTLRLQPVRDGCRIGRQLDREGAGEGAPTIEIPHRNADQHRNPEMDRVGDRLAQAAAIGFDLAELVDHQKAWFVRVQAGRDGFGDVCQDGDVKAATARLLAAMLGDGSDFAGRQVLELEVARMATRSVGGIALNGAGERDAALAQRLDRATDRMVRIDAVGIDQSGDQ
jgi:hypothetical protein